jgi:hypothetical protein
MMFGNFAKIGHAEFFVSSTSYTENGLTSHGMVCMQLGKPQTGCPNSDPDLW